MKKILLEFKEKEYQAAEQNFKSKERFKEKLLEEFYSLLGSDFKLETVPESAYSNMLALYYEVLEQQAGFPALMKGERIAATLGVKTSSLTAAQANYNKAANLNKPDIEKYKIYAETPEEIEKYNIAQEFLALIAKTSDLSNIPAKWREVSYPYLLPDFGKLKPNTDYIKKKPGEAFYHWQKANGVTK